MIILGFEHLRLSSSISIPPKGILTRWILSRLIFANTPTLMIAFPPIPFAGESFH